MAFVLSLATPTLNTALTTLTLTDNTGTGATGWGGGNPAVPSINGATLALTVQLKIYTPADPAGITYDVIDFYTYNNDVAPTTTADLVFELTTDMILYNATPLSATSDTFPDGWYEVTYTATFIGGAVADTYTTSFFNCGTIFYDITKNFLDIPEAYTLRDHFKDRYASDIINNVLYQKALYESMNANVVESNRDEIVSVLGTIQRINYLNLNLN